MCELRSFSFILYKVGVTMERFVLQKYTFRFGLVIRFVLRIIKTNLKNKIVRKVTVKSRDVVSYRLIK